MHAVRCPAMTLTSLIAAARDFARETVGEIRGLPRRDWGAGLRFTAGHKAELAAAALLIALFHQAYFWTGRYLLEHGVLLVGRIVRAGPDLPSTRKGFAESWLRPGA